MSQKSLHMIRQSQRIRSAIQILQPLKQNPQSPQIKPCMVQLCRLDGRSLRTMGQLLFHIRTSSLLVLPIPKQYVRSKSIFSFEQSGHWCGQCVGWSHNGDLWRRHLLWFQPKVAAQLTMEIQLEDLRQPLHSSSRVSGEATMGIQWEKPIHLLLLPPCPVHCSPCLHLLIILT